MTRKSGNNTKKSLTGDKTKSLCPIFLTKEDRIGLFSPGGFASPKLIKEGARVLKSLGFEVIPSEVTFAPDARASGPIGSFDYLSASDTVRLDEIRSLMKGPFDALLAVRGGHGSLRILPRLDPLWSGFPEKPILGFSDVTALHLARLAKTGIGGWHAPNLLYYAKSNFKNYNDYILGERKREWFFSPGKVVRPGEAQGPVLGGNLTLFASLYGTEYCPDSKGKILLLEDVGEKPYSIDRLLNTLSLRGAFRGALAVIFGKFIRCGFPRIVRDIAKDFFSSFEIPVLINAPFGHGIENIPWFYGELAELRIDKDNGGTIVFPSRVFPSR
jgi:muramoyltetrapeptide carboxypeptidase